MELLQISQIVFNIIASVAMLVIGAVFCLIAYRIVVVLNAVHHFFDGLNEKSEVLYNNLNRALIGMPIISFIMNFFKKKESQEK